MKEFQMLPLIARAEAINYWVYNDEQTLWDEL